MLVSIGKVNGKRSKSTVCQTYLLKGQREMEKQMENECKDSCFEELVRDGDRIFCVGMKRKNDVDDSTGRRSEVHPEVEISRSMIVE